MGFLRNTRDVHGEAAVRLNLLGDELLSDELGVELAKSRGKPPQNSPCLPLFILIS